MVIDSSSEVGVLICSSDSRKDVLERTLPSIFKYCPDCPYRIYIGVNSTVGTHRGVTSVLALPSDWRRETLQQVAQIPETHLIVVLDDFLFQEPVNQTRLSMLVSKVVSSGLPYLRLLPLGKSLAQRLIPFPRSRSAVEIQAIKETRPFYSCLQIAIWNKAHFASILRLEGSIWDFEHQRRAGVPHYAIIDSPPFAYRHLVEKGRWL